MSTQKDLDSTYAASGLEEHNPYKVIVDTLQQHLSNGKIISSLDPGVKNLSVDSLGVATITYLSIQDPDDRPAAGQCRPHRRSGGCHE